MDKVVFPLNSFKFPSPKYALYQVSLKSKELLKYN